MAYESFVIKMHSTENRFVMRPETVLFLRRVRAFFHPGNVTGWCSEGVKLEKRSF